MNPEECPKTTPIVQIGAQNSQIFYFQLRKATHSHTHTASTAVGALPVIVYSFAPSCLYSLLYTNDNGLRATHRCLRCCSLERYVHVWCFGNDKTEMKNESEISHSESASIFPTADWGEIITSPASPHLVQGGARASPR